MPLNTSRLIWRYRWKTMVHPLLVGTAITTLIVLPGLYFLRQSNQLPQPLIPTGVTTTIITPIKEINSSSYPYVGAIRFHGVVTTAYSLTPLERGEVVKVFYYSTPRRRGEDNIVVEPQTL